MTTSTNEQIILAALNVSGAKPVYPTKKRSQNPDPDVRAQEQALFDQQFNALVADFEAADTAYDQAVKANARDIKVMLSDRSAVNTQLAQLDKALGDGSDGKIFVGTIVGVAKETSSKRGLVTVHTGTERENRDLPAGQEQVRTDRTDNPDGQAIARLAQRLVGHRVVLYVELEAIRGGSTKVRVVRHLEDKGIDPNYDAATRTVNASS